MPMVDFDLVQEAQTRIHGVGVIEYIELENRTEFSDSISRFTDSDVYFDKREAHPQITRIRKGYGQQIELPDEYTDLFEYVYLQPFVETHQLGEVTLYGVIDDESFNGAQSRFYDEQHESENIGHAGLKALRSAEESLSNFLKNEVNRGLFTEEADNWARNAARNETHPSFWIYDFTDVPDANGVEYLTDHVSELTYLGLGNSENRFNPLMEFYDGRCAMNRNIRDYFITDLGSFPFRHVIVHFQTEEGEGFLPEFSMLEDPDLDFVTRGNSKGIPMAPGLGVAELARVYNWLLWALKTYHDTSSHSPFSILPDDSNFESIINQFSKSKKYNLMNSLQQGRYDLHNFWNDQRRQFDSLETLIDRRGVIDSSARELLDEPLEQARDIEGFADERVDRVRADYENIIQRLKDDLDVGLNIDVKRLTWVVTALTVGNILAVWVSTSAEGLFPITIPGLTEISPFWLLPFIPLALVIGWFYRPFG